jgi:hypothetical protein
MTEDNFKVIVLGCGVRIISNELGKIFSRIKRNKLSNKYTGIRKPSKGDDFAFVTRKRKQRVYYPLNMGRNIA